MNQENQGHAREEGERWGGGLPMVVLPSPEKLAEERKTLVELEHQGFAARTRGYWKFVGPGYMQSALTLGSGSVASALSVARCSAIACCGLRRLRCCLA